MSAGLWWLWAMADAAYTENYWAAVAASERWLALLHAATRER